jgi:hypothetical protein
LTYDFEGGVKAFSAEVQNQSQPNAKQGNNQAHSHKCVHISFKQNSTIFIASSDNKINFAQLGTSCKLNLG